MIKRILVLMVLVAMLSACGSRTTPIATTAPVSASKLKIVASTSWVGAYALAAGATNITLIAPSTFQHPPDYNPKPSDLAAISDADYVLMAGYEGFATHLQEAVGGDTSKLITVMTENSPEVIHKEVTRLGELFGTQEAAVAYLIYFDTQYSLLTGDVKARIGEHHEVVVAQAFVTPWATFAGLEISGTYGPMPITPEELKVLVDKKPAVILENWHMGGGNPIVESTGALKIDLINFPDENLDLLHVFFTNATRIEDAFAKQASNVPMEMGTDPFEISVAQIIMNTAGFHEIATALSETQSIDHWMESHAH
jgi:zinc transport system substrate-binding protein